MALPGGGRVRAVAPPFTQGHLQNLVDLTFFDKNMLNLKNWVIFWCFWKVYSQKFSLIIIIYESFPLRWNPGYVTDGSSNIFEIKEGS